MKKTKRDKFEDNIYKILDYRDLNPVLVKNEVNHIYYSGEIILNEKICFIILVLFFLPFIINPNLVFFSIISSILLIVGHSILLFGKKIKLVSSTLNIILGLLFMQRGFSLYMNTIPQLQDLTSNIKLYLFFSQSIIVLAIISEVVAYYKIKNNKYTLYRYIPMFAFAIGYLLLTSINIIL